ncbi:hypothetical protein GIB67_027288 [Kingdonia uniflora]|uniref:YDG domain-containing protein n=1 Tax=Kingdonia uniflora TaxID=39325 RepID=A0A7J7KYQ5_9MAGN|nr:hypothetical protein GIB67_027288 [Kingdonia uniflora]
MSKYISPSESSKNRSAKHLLEHVLRSNFKRRNFDIVRDSPEGSAPCAIPYTENPLHVVKEGSSSKKYDPRGVGSALREFPSGVGQGLHVLAEKLKKCQVDKAESSEAGAICGMRGKFRETVHLFQAVHRKLMRNEEAKPKEKLSTPALFGASNLLKKHDYCINTSDLAILGVVPGVQVGDEFHYRVELCIIGLHRHLQSGIDYVKRGNLLLATSIVASGGYTDDTDDSDVLQYSGQGGNPLRKDKEAKDQKLERGNLALKNSIDAKTPVRVIHGFNTAKGSSCNTKDKTVTTFIYDGLYLVESYRQEIGKKYGKNVYIFCLRRIPGQPDLPLTKVRNSGKAKVREGLCVADILKEKRRCLSLL